MNSIFPVRLSQSYLFREPVCQAARIRFGLAAFLVCILALFVTPRHSVALDIGVTWNGQLYQSKSPSEWEAVKRSGAKIYRLGIFREHWQKYGVGYFDQIFQFAGERDIRILPHLYGTNSEPYPLPGSAAFDEWDDWAKELVERYGHSGTFWAGKPYYKPVTAWEVGNEPNLGVASPGGVVQPANYGKLLVHVSAAIRSASHEQSGSNTQVLMAGLYLGPTGSEGMKYDQFLEQAYTVPGVYSAYDGLAIHPYAFNAGEQLQQFKNEINGVRNLLNSGKLQWGPSRSLWITEMGWTVDDFGDPTFQDVTETQQATLLQQSFDWVESQASQLNMQSLIWYNFRDRPEIKSWDYRIGLIGPNYQFRPAWSAFQNQTGAASWSGPWGEEGIQGEDDSHPGPHPIGQVNSTIDVFFRTPASGLGHTWKGVGGGWASGGLPGSLHSMSVPHSVVQLDGTIDVFWRTPSNGLGHAWYAPCCGGWSSNTLPGTLASDPYPVLQPNGTIDVFWRTPADQLGHAWKGAGGGWAQADLPGPVGSDPYPVAQPNGTVDVFYRTPSGGLGHSWYGSGGGWSQGSLAGSVGAASRPRAVVQPNGTIDVLWRTSSNGLGHAWYAPCCGGWSSGTLPGSLASDPHAVLLPDGTIDVFWRTPSDQLGHAWKDADGGWAQADLPDPVGSDPYPVAQPNGTIDVFYRTPSNGLGHAWKGSGGDWANGGLPGSLHSLTVPLAVAQANGTIDVFYGTPSGALGHNWYAPCCGGWFSNVLPGSIAL